LIAHRSGTISNRAESLGHVVTVSNSTPVSKMTLYTGGKRHQTCAVVQMLEARNQNYRRLHGPFLQWCQHLITVSNYGGVIIPLDML